jgi:manganese/zinc/iron transport system substrate-binding protein
MHTRLSTYRPVTALFALVALPLVLALAGCGGEDDSPATTSGADTPFQVVTTVGMIGDLVEQVAGDRAAVTTLIGAGVDPHSYSPTRSDMALLQQADVIFYNGLLLEGKMTDALIRAGTSGKPVHAVTALLDEDDLLSPEEFEGLNDPHVWMDPTAWAEAVRVIEAKLTEHDPAGAAIYEANAADLTERIRALDAYAERVLATVPEDRRVLVTAHDAFNYFGERFGFEVVGIQGLSTESEAGLQDIERIVDLLVERGVGAVFIETTINPRNVEALIRGAADQGHEVRIGGELFSDAMGPAGTYEGTYVGMIDHNVTTIARALGGQAPEQGMAGEMSGEG